MPSINPPIASLIQCSPLNTLLTKVSETNKADLETVVTTEVEKVVKSEPEVERPTFDYSKCNNGAAMNTNNENRKKIKNLNL